MSVETRSQTIAEEADNGARPKNGAESDRARVAASSLPAAPQPEQANLRGETFVIEKTDTGVTTATTDLPEPAPAKASVALFDQNLAEKFRSRWNEIQVAFVDEPRDAVTRADELVAETIKELSESFTAKRQKLEAEWDRGGDDSTETLRLALQRYRSFFNRLLSV